MERKNVGVFKKIFPTLEEILIGYLLEMSYRFHGYIVSVSVHGRKVFFTAKLHLIYFARIGSVNHKECKYAIKLINCMDKLEEIN